MLLAANVTASIGLLGLAALGIAGHLAIPAAFVFAALATLAKGPLGALLPALAAARLRSRRARLAVPRAVWHRPSDGSSSCSSPRPGTSS